MSFSLLRRELSIALRSRAEMANPLIFYAMVITLFPLGLGPEPAKLAALAPGLLWVVALLACLLASDSLFRADFDNGTLELALLSPVPAYWFVLNKCLSHWLITGLPLSLFSPILGVTLQLPGAALPVLAGSLALGTFALSLVGAVGAALTVGLRRGGLLLSLIVLPLYVPVLIFGAGAVDAVLAGFSAHGELAVLGALLLTGVALAPLAIAAGLRISVDN